MTIHLALLILAQYSGAPGIGFVLTVVYVGCAISGLMHLWGKEGHFHDFRSGVKVLLTLAIVGFPVVLLVLVKLANSN